MTAVELNKYVAERIAQGMTIEAIAGGLGITLECLYRKMAEDDEK